MRSKIAAVSLISTLFATSAFAGEANVVGVEIVKRGAQFYISATVKHDDEGWDHYANRWDVLDEQGNVLGERVLAHPHENEQPFTRSTSVAIPESVKKVTIRANDSVHELGGQEKTLDVPH